MKKLERFMNSPVTSVLFLILVFVFVIDWNNLTKSDYVLMGATVFYVLATLFNMITEMIKKRLEK
ncbi:TPA: hypothetical protein ACQUHN_005875 [Bacillus thuringiensis]|nr:hypothetical protein AC241_32400 [Bacillus thuringiensis]HDR8145518.1 hypothetical protein [Bacillus cereus]OJE03126.1 hypothetical protein A9489_22375 [Bacillus thuringiensis]PEW24229.1 hypothetical protein CN427_26815 [Bacillus thuringiensis]PFA83762.1 hypothetical protein CN400_16950 [Bacillus thuringiensis]